MHACIPYIPFCTQHIWFWSRGTSFCTWIGAKWRPSVNVNVNRECIWMPPFCMTGIMFPKVYTVYNVRWWQSEFSSWIHGCFFEVVGFKVGLTIDYRQLVGRRAGINSFYIKYWWGFWWSLNLSWFRVCFCECSTPATKWTVWSTCNMYKLQHKVPSTVLNGQ